MKALRWRELARRDADKAAEWYAQQGGLALELAFIDALESAMDTIAAFPACGSPQHAFLLPELDPPLRYLPLQRFDRYLVYYREFEAHVEIVRVWDAARDVPTPMEGPSTPR